jgi:hypothetical protein
MAGSKSNFRFTPESRLNSEIAASPTSANSRHRAAKIGPRRDPAFQSLKRRQQMRHIKNFKQRGSARICPGKGNEVDKKRHSEQRNSSVIRRRAHGSIGKSIADQLDDGAKWRLYRGGRLPEFDGFNDFRRYAHL